ncbi:centromere protein S-like [Arapaima gigas]
MDEEFSHHQRLKAALHFTVGRLCEDIAGSSRKKFSKELVAAIAETTFRQCGFYKTLVLHFDLRHAKRTTVNSEDVKLVARRSTALYNYITRKSEELASTNQEQKERRRKNTGKKKENGQSGAGTSGNVDCDMT